MAQQHGRNAALWIDDNNGVCRNLTGDFNSVTLTWSRTNAEVTGLGDDSTQRISGIREINLTAAIVWNSGAVNVDGICASLMGSSAISVIRYAPGGSIAGSPLYIACMLINSYSVTAPVNGAVAAAVSFEMAAGSMTASAV